MVNECLRGNAIMFDPFRAMQKGNSGAAKKKSGQY